VGCSDRRAGHTEEVAQSWAAVVHRGRPGASARAPADRDWWGQAASAGTKHGRWHWLEVEGGGRWR
jgi:hypothetical protein